MGKQVIEPGKIKCLVQYIKDHRVPMAELAEGTGVSRVFISYALNGKKKMPAVLFAKLIVVLGLDEGRLHEYHRMYMEDLNQTEKRKLADRILRIASGYALSDDDLRDCMEQVIDMRRGGNDNNKNKEL